jgi:hypothetical protein
MMEWLAPVFAAALTAATGITAAVMLYRGTRTGARESRAPDVTDSWAEADRARQVAWRALDLVWKLRSAFRSYWMRVLAGGSTELTAAERAAMEAEPPTIDPDPPKSPA